MRSANLLELWKTVKAFKATSPPSSKVGFWFPFEVLWIHGMIWVLAANMYSTCLLYMCSKSNASLYGPYSGQLMEVGRLLVSEFH